MARTNNDEVVGFTWNFSLVTQLLFRDHGIIVMRVLVYEKAK